MLERTGVDDRDKPGHDDIGVCNGLPRREGGRGEDFYFDRFGEGFVGVVRQARGLRACGRAVGGGAGVAGLPRGCGDAGFEGDGLADCLG